MKRHVIVPSGAFANIVHDDLIVDAGVAAAVEHKRAWHLDGSDVEHKKNARRCAVTYCPPALRDLISSPEVSIETVIEWLEKDKLANAPEYVLPRPKYARYYEAMRERIREHYPELPAPVMDKLLALDAGELDLLLQYPTAIRGQTEEFLDVYRAEGGTYLETYKTPALSWKEVKAMKGEGTVGLEAAGPGSSEAAMFKDEAPLFAASDSDDEDTNRAMLGASGDDGLTAEEEAGLVLNASGTLNAPALPPDQARSIQKFFTHISVSTLDRVSFQLTGELFLYGTTFSCESRVTRARRRRKRSAPSRRAATATATRRRRGG